MSDKHLCLDCKFGLVIDTIAETDNERFNFCNVLETPLKLSKGRVVAECTGFKAKR